MMTCFSENGENRGISPSLFLDVPSCNNWCNSSSRHCFLGGIKSSVPSSSSSQAMPHCWATCVVSDWGLHTPMDCSTTAAWRYKKSGLHINAKSGQWANSRLQSSVIVFVDEWQAIRSRGEELVHWMVRSEEVEFIDWVGANSFKGVYIGKKVWVTQLRGWDLGSAYGVEIRLELFADGHAPLVVLCCSMPYTSCLACIRVNCAARLLWFYATFFPLNTKVMKLRKASSLS
jgi:hypothetical protein